jgi:ankyrin repeat protein
VNRLLRPTDLCLLFLFTLWIFLWPPLSYGQNEMRLWHAAASGDLEEVKSQIQHGSDVNLKGPGGFNALNAAARNGHLEVVQYLVEHGANIDQSDNHLHKTALLAASFQRHFDIVKYLVEKGANVNAQSINGFTPLHDAAYVGNFPIVQFLVEHGADVRIRNEHNQTPLETAQWGSSRAAGNGRTDATPEDYQKVIEYLKAHGG